MNFLKRFFDYLKMLLKKQEKIEEKIEASEESNGEDLSLEQEEIQTEDLYSQIEIGDIIRAKRYKNETQKESIPEGHREGPYIVLNKDNGNLICTQGTSVVPYKEDDDVYFYLNVEGYNLVKSTFFKLFRIDEVNNNQIIKVIDKLKEEDKQRLFRKIKLSHKTYYTSEGSLIRLNLPIQIGDIINYNGQNLLVLDINKNNLICLLLKETIDYKDNKLLEYINFKNLDYSKTNCLEINSKLKYINAINNKCLKSILKDWQEYISNCKNTKITQRGSVVIKDNNYYYIYGEEGQDWLAFEINKNYVKNFQKIKIGDTEYYTNYTDTKISKKESLINIYLCYESDKDKIKQLRKTYKETNKNKFLYLNVGDIIETSNNKRYIIIKLHPKTYECLEIDKIKLGIYDPVLIKRVDSRISKNTSIDGIKWLEWNPGFKLTKISDQKNLAKILETQKKFLEEFKVSNESKKVPVKRGTIIYKCDKQYYIYGEEANYWLVFKLEKEFYSKYDKLQIDNITYYTNYEDFRISKNDEMHATLYCTEQEIDNIKEKRRLYKRLTSVNKNINKREELPNEINCVIKLNEFSDETFIVKDLLGDTLICVSSTDSNTRIPRKYYFNKNNVIFVKSKQKRK